MHMHIIYKKISDECLSAFSMLFRIAMFWGFLSHLLPSFYFKCSFAINFSKKPQQQNP